MFRGKETFLIFEQTFSMKYKISLFSFLFVALSWSSYAQVKKIYTFAGNGFAGFSGDGALASAAEFSGPIAVALDKQNNVYVVDFYNNRIRKINTSGIITTVAGSGLQGYTGDGTYATSANMSPHGVAVDKKGNIFFSDAGYGVIRKVNTLGIVSTVAGGLGYGYTGDGGPATAAKFSNVYGITLDDTGNLYVADAGNHAIRKIDTFGVVSTVAGSGVAGFTGDGGVATLATLDSPYTVAIDRSGNLYITDYDNNAIRVVDPTGTISTAVNTAGTHGYTGDAGLAIAATLNNAKGIAVDTLGNLYIADADNSVVRKVDHITGIITTVAGNGTLGFGGDLSYALGANLYNPYGLAVDAYGGIFIADANNQRIRKTYNPAVAVNTVTLNAAMEISPNPFVEDIAVSGLAQSDKVAIYDVIGRQVSPTWDVVQEGTRSFHISGLSSGMYILQVCNSEGSRKMVARLVKE